MRYSVPPVLTIALIICLLATRPSRGLPPGGGGDRLTGLPFAGRSEVIARQGMAATSQPLATQVAVDILKRGGSAADAAPYTIRPSGH